MSFRCPVCGIPESLIITSSLELPPDNRSDEIALQTIECTSCEFRGFAVYEESRRGPINRDSFQHVGYHTSDRDFKGVVKLLHRCPASKNKNCRCDTHKQLAVKDPFGRWVGLSRFKHHSPFPLE